MNNHCYFLIGFVAILQSCTSEDSSTANLLRDSIQSADSIASTRAFLGDQLSTEYISFDGNKDNIIETDRGTTFRIDAGTFTDTNGNPVFGNIDFQVIEVLNSSDMVRANLFTVTNGQALESGGMLFVDAYAGNTKLKIAENKFIVVKMPSIGEVKDGMSLFEGVREGNTVNWVQPAAIPPKDSARKILLDALEKTTNVTYSVDGFTHQPGIPGYGYPEEVNSEVSRIAWEGSGLKIPRDTSFVYNGYTVRFFRNDKLTTWTQYMYGEAGKNTYAEDLKTNYIFQLKKLGWANIDRLAKDARTREVDLKISVEKVDQYGYIYFTLITQNMYLPGYKRKDQLFSFSHGDDEKQLLPVGESAIVLATTYLNGVPYYALERIIISEKQDLVIKLQQTTEKDLKAVLNYNL